MIRFFRKSPNAPEPAPKATEGRPVWELVIEDMRERDRMGRAKYGVPLRAHNGRDPLVDLYQELLDAAVYVRQEIEERKARRGCYVLPSQLGFCVGLDCRAGARLDDRSCEMSKPVTELYKAADIEWEQHRDDRLEAALDALSLKDATINSPLFEVLDLVATLPPERLGLVRWVMGLDAAQVEMLRMALDTQRESALLVGNRNGSLLESFVAALSGGEGGAKAETSYPDSAKEDIGELEARLSEVRAKIRSYDGGDRPSSPPVAVLREERELIQTIEAKENADSTPVPDILPGGKPPPCLEIGMRLQHPVAGVPVTVAAMDSPMAFVRGLGVLGWVQIQVLLTWPLAEDFAVEGKS